MEQASRVVDRNVNINAHLSSLKQSLTDTKSLKHLLHFLNNKLAVLRVDVLSFCGDFKQWHTRSVVVNKQTPIFANRSRGVILFHLHALDQDMRFNVLVVVVEKTTIDHYGIMLLGDLISLWQVRVGVVLAIKLDERRDTSSQGKSAPDSLVKAVFVENWQHSGDTKVEVANVSVWLSGGVRAEGGYNQN